MVIEFLLPDLGEGIHEAEVQAVMVKEGDSVTEDQPILEVETDKAVVQIPSPVAGKVEKIHVHTGQVVTVGSVMMSFNKGDGAKAETAAKGSAKAAPAAAQTDASKEFGTAAKPPAARVTATAEAPPAARTIQGNGNGTVHTGSRPVPAAPATRRLARELGVDLHVVRASGPAGRVTKEDVRNHVEGTLEQSIATVPALKQASSPAAATNSSAISAASLATKYGESTGGKDAEPMTLTAMSSAPIELPDFSKYGKIERIPLRSIRRKIAQNMATSWSRIPHVTTFDEVDITQLDAFIGKQNEKSKQKAGRLTITVFALKAIASGLKKYPQFNASLDERSGELVFKHYYNIGVAVATERGLIVPVIKNVDQKSVMELAAELGEIAEKTRAGKVELDRLQGGTFTLTNIGAIGGTSMSPMINFPEAAILGMARASQKPIVRDGKIEIGLILPLALSFDHRIADGAEAAYFVQHVVQRLQDPLTFLLEG